MRKLAPPRLGESIPANINPTNSLTAMHVIASSFSSSNTSADTSPLLSCLPNFSASALRVLLRAIRAIDEPLPQPPLAAPTTFAL